MLCKHICYEVDLSVSIAYYLIMYNQVQLESDITSNHSGSYKNNINERTDRKFAAGTITKNFFAPVSYEDDSDFVGLTSPSKKDPALEKRELQQGQKQSRARREKRQTPVLTPLDQGKKVEVYQNYQRNNQNDHLQEIEAIKQDIKIQKQPESEIKKRPRRRVVKKEEQIKEPVQQERSQEKAQQKEETKADSKQNQILFQDETIEIPKTEQISQPEAHDEQQQVRIPQPRITNEFVQSDEENIEVNSQEIQTIATGSEYFNFSNQITLMKQLNIDVRERTTLKMEIIRDKDGFNTFWPEFHLQFAEDSRYVMSAKKTASRPTSTFILSRSRGNYQETGSYYLGKMKSNVLGDVLNVFGPGPNPAKAKQLGVHPRQLLATIVFMTSLFQMGKPRQFRVFIKKIEYQYYCDFPQVKMYEDEISLSALAEFPENKKKIRVLHNRQPVWVKEIGGYMLNFRGRVQRPSIKNFIIEQTLNGPDVVLFGKVNDNKFNLDVSSGISAIIAFAIALSSFDSRLMCE